MLAKTGNANTLSRTKNPVNPYTAPSDAAYFVSGLVSLEYKPFGKAGYFLLPWVRIAQVLAKFNTKIWRNTV